MKKFTRDIRFLKFSMENISVQEKTEDRIIDAINSGAEGRLIIYKPPKGDTNIDLVVEVRGGYKTKPYNFKVVCFSGREDKNFIKDFLQEPFKADKNLFLIFAYFDTVAQKLNDKVWLVPSIDFADTAEVIKQDKENLLRFESVKFSKFLMDKSELADFLMEGFKTNGKFVFKGSGVQEKRELNLESLKEFIAEARRNTYASSSTGVDNPRLLGSTQLEFQKRDFFYRDIYFSGDKKFIGQEIVYQNSKPVWGMGYIGDAISKLEEKFLKEALLELSEKCRFGGSFEHIKREHKYQDKGQGSIEDFSGQEKIFVENKEIYKLSYHGGLLSK